MKKIPTIFERDWNGDRSKVLPEVHAGCEWVLAGEGVATHKLDGTCCMIRDGKLYKRYEFKPKKAMPGYEILPTYPIGFEVVEVDEATGNRVGWVPVEDTPENKWHLEAFATLRDKADGTYELVGPKIQGNPEGVPYHQLVPHSIQMLGLLNNPPPRDFDGLTAYLVDNPMEGIVFHHPDGRMAKIKGRDFGIKRVKIP